MSRLLQTITGSILRTRGLWPFCIGGWALFIGACISPDRTVVADTNPALWRIPVELRFENNDSLSSRRIELFLRLNERFDSDTLTVQIETRSPDSIRFREYHRLHIQSRTTAAPLRQIASIPYRRHVILSRCGNYYFRISPTRRVKGIEAVGLQFINE